MGFGRERCSAFTQRGTTVVTLLGSAAQNEVQIGAVHLIVRACCHELQRGARSLILGIIELNDVSHSHPVALVRQRQVLAGIAVGHGCVGNLLLGHLNGRQCREHLLLDLQLEGEATLSCLNDVALIHYDIKRDPAERIAVQCGNGRRSPLSQISLIFFEFETKTKPKKLASYCF